MRPILSLTTSITVLLALGSSPYARAEGIHYDRYFEKKLVNLCRLAMQDRVVRLNVALKESRLRYSTIAKGLVCNGMGVGDFAMKYGAQRTAKRILRHAPQSSSVEIKDIAATSSVPRKPLDISVSFQTAK